MKEVQLQIDMPTDGNPVRILKPLLQLVVDGELIGNVCDITLDEKLKAPLVVTASFIVRKVIKPTVGE